MEMSQKIDKPAEEIYINVGVIAVAQGANMRKYTSEVFRMLSETLSLNG